MCASSRPVITSSSTPTGYPCSAYWELAPHSSTPQGNSSGGCRLVDQALRTSVRDNLVADVPVGIYLSGGVDSSLLTAMTRRENPGQLLHTFRGEFRRRTTTTRLVWARKVAELNGTNHHEVVVTADDFLNNWAKLSWHTGRTVVRTGGCRGVSTGAAGAREVKVVLSGEGSDELFAGYPKYKFAGEPAGSAAVPSLGLLGRLESALPASKARLGIAMRAIDESTYDERLRGWFAPFTVAGRDRITGRRSHTRRARPHTARGVATPCIGCSMRTHASGSPTICSSGVTGCRWPPR